jgi:Protein of unknown function (DUF3631)
MVDEIITYLKKYVILPSDESYLVLALYTIHTWTIGVSRSTPYIYINSPTKGCGKTRCLEVMKTLMRNPIQALDITPAAMYRMIEDQQPTLMVDEVDTIWNGAKNDDLRKVLNGGYRRGNVVWRMHKSQPTPFDTFCPKLLAGIFNMQLPDTVRDRSIPITMRAAKDDETVGAFYPEEAQEEANKLITQIEAWMKTNSEALMKRVPPMDDIGDRQWEIAEPLVLIGDALGIGDRARNAIRFLFEAVKGYKSKDVGIIQQIVEAFGDDDKIFTEELLTELGGKWTAEKLARELSNVGISSTTVRKGNRVLKGYKREQFAAVLGELDSISITLEGEADVTAGDGGVTAR